ncbi:MAG TPA: metal-dependent transcriptional regulator [Coriobacteriia bacterium]|jgi:DtxR family Mn-dependent transcriptional regulator
MPSATIEEYLEAIYKLSEKGEVRPTHLADALGVSGPTVTATLRRLEAADLVSRPAGGVSLTDSGRTQALSIVRRHRLAERFLADVLELPWDLVHDEACTLEHALSPRVQEALERYMDNPEVCPHGHPIPTADLSIAELAGTPLAEHAAGEHVEVIRVAEDDEQLLAYLASHGLFPGAAVDVVDVSPFEGPFLLRVKDETFALGRDIAGKVIVKSAA